MNLWIFNGTGFDGTGSNSHPSVAGTDKARDVRKSAAAAFSR
jgi:hypothetical protein